MKRIILSTTASILCIGFLACQAGEFSPDDQDNVSLGAIPYTGPIGKPGNDNCVHECDQVGARQCNGNGFQACNQNESDSCLTWGLVVPCQNNEICENGQCVTVEPACNDTCPAQGVTECTDANHFRTCNDFDQDGCFEWGQAQACLSSKTCQFGVCANANAIIFDVKADQSTGDKIKQVFSRHLIGDISHVYDRMENGQLVNPLLNLQIRNPFFKEVLVGTATGGRDTNEMYNPSGNHDFSKLTKALNNVIAVGYHPIITIGNMPEALSTRPGDKGAFNTNIGAPTDYWKYFDYIKALFSHLVKTYGKQTVESWEYRLMTEPDSIEWWHDGFEEFKVLYDFTLAAMRSAEYANGALVNLNIGLDVGNLYRSSENSLVVAQQIPEGNCGPKSINGTARVWTDLMAKWLASSTSITKQLLALDFVNGNYDTWNKEDNSVLVKNGMVWLNNGEVIAGSPTWHDFKMTLKMKTVVSGVQPWQVGWIKFRYVDQNNYYAVGLLSNGVLQLSKKQNGIVQNVVSILTGLSPFAWHNFSIKIVGRNIEVSIDDISFIKHTSFDRFCQGDGRIGAEAFGAPDVRIDDVEITTVASAHDKALPRTRHRVSLSCYACGQMTLDARDLRTLITDVRSLISQDMPNALVSCDEFGMLCVGDNKENKGPDGTEFGAAWHAAMFKIAHEENVNLESFSLYDMYWHWGLKSPSYNVIEMTQKFSGLVSGQMSTRVQVSTPKGVGTVETDAYVDSIAAKHPDGKISVLLFNQNKDRAATQEEELIVRVAGLTAKKKYTVIHYRVDKNHSNFFTTWLTDIAGNESQYLKQGMSKYGLYISMAATQEGQNLFFQKMQSYKAIDDLQVMGLAIKKSADANGSMARTITLPPNSVSYIEIIP